MSLKSYSVIFKASHPFGQVLWLHVAGFGLRIRSVELTMLKHNDLVLCRAQQGHALR